MPGDAACLVSPAEAGSLWGGLWRGTGGLEGGGGGGEGASFFLLANFPASILSCSHSLWQGWVQFQSQQFQSSPGPSETLTSVAYALLKGPKPKKLLFWVPEPPRHTSQTPPPSHPTAVSQGPGVIVANLGSKFHVPVTLSPSPHLPSLGVFLEPPSLSCLSYSFPVCQSYKCIRWIPHIKFFPLA